MRGFKIVVLCMVGILFFAGFAFAQTEGQKKLLARRAALVDAYRNLAEAVHGLRIDSQTYVRDFVAESDQIRTDLDTFLKGARVTRTTYLPDGICEVEVEIPIKEIVIVLERIKREYVLPGWKTVYFDRIYEYYTESSIKATGSGLPREEGKSATTAVTASIPGWENVTPRGRLMAQRAALVDAYRNLAERIMGLRIDSQTYVRDFVAESDQIRTDLDTWIRGIKPCSPYRYLPDGICEVDVEVPVRQVVERLVRIRRRVRRWRNVRYETIKLKTITDLSPVETIRATGSGVPPAKYMTQSAVDKSCPTWASGDEVATGVGVPPKDTTGTQARLMAERAAKVDALRNLAERVYGVKIDAVTTVRDFVTQHDIIKADVESFIRGARVADTRYLSDGSVEVDVAINLGGMWKIFKRCDL